MKLSSLTVVETINPGWLFQNPQSFFNCKMKASNTKSMLIAKGYSSRGEIRIQSRSDILSDLTDPSNISDDVGLTLQIDDNLRCPIHCQQQEPRYAVLKSETHNTCIDSNNFLNFDSSCDDVIGNQLSIGNPTGSNLQRDFFQAFRQPTPLTPVQSPPHDNEPCQSSSCLCKSTCLERQTSLSIALEVLGEPMTNYRAEDCYPPTPPSEDDEARYVQYPSPSYVEHLAAIPQQLARTRTVSDHTEYVSFTSALDENPRIRAFSADNPDCLYDLNFSPGSILADAESNPESTSDKENQSDTSSISGTDSSASSSVTTATSSSIKEKQNASLISLPSFLRDACENPAPSDGNVEESLDMAGMLQDFLDDADKLLKAKDERALKQREAVAADHTYSAKHCISVDTIQTSTNLTSPTKDSSKEQYATTNTTPAKVVVDLTKEGPCTSSSTPKLEKSPSYIRKRSQNNRACRESRKKRKTERDEAESKVKFLAQDNEDMKKKIKELELEVKETRALLISRMVNQ